MSPLLSPWCFLALCSWHIGDSLGFQAVTYTAFLVSNVVLLQVPMQLAPPGLANALWRWVTNLLCFSLRN